MTNLNKLSDANIERAENFINNNQPREGCPSISICDAENAKELFNDFKNEPITSYSLFGSNAYGMSSYGFYKTKDERVFILEAFINNLTGYCEIDNCPFLK
jgi:hypothetical protein